MGDIRLLTTYDEFSYDVITETVKPAKIVEANGQHVEIPAVKKIILKGILQKADTLNQNGRIYPLEILEREVRNYQKFILESRALGECVPPGTEIYTRDGWKRIEDIGDDEIVMTLNVETNDMELQRIDRKVVLPFDGQLYHFKNARSIDMCVTPNHKILVWDRNNVPRTVLAQELYDAVCSTEKATWLSDSCIKCEDSYDSLDFRFLQHEAIAYKGNVYCVTTKNTTWLMRYNGKVCWTHNCDHPDSSVIELKNTSHIIREAYLKEKVVYGTVELLNTPSGKILQSLVESKVKLGISSRGVGSVQKQGDYYVVQDDFQLICWDFVSEPSTPGAFMLPEGRALSVQEANLFTRRFDVPPQSQSHINSIIDDILSYRGR